MCWLLERSSVSVAVSRAVLIEEHKPSYIEAFICDLVSLPRRRF